MNPPPAKSAPLRPDCCRYFGCEAISGDDGYCCSDHRILAIDGCNANYAYVVHDGFPQEAERDRRIGMGLIQLQLHPDRELGIPYALDIIANRNLLFMPPWEWHVIDSNPFLTDEASRSWLLFYPIHKPNLPGLFDYYGAKLWWTRIKTYDHTCGLSKEVIEVSTYQIEEVPFHCDYQGAAVSMEGVEDLLRGWSLSEHRYKGRCLWCLSFDGEQNKIEDYIPPAPKDGEPLGRQNQERKAKNDESLGQNSVSLKRKGPVNCSPSPKKPNLPSGQRAGRVEVAEDEDAREQETDEEERVEVEEEDDSGEEETDEEVRSKYHGPNLRENLESVSIDTNKDRERHVIDLDKDEDTGEQEKDEDTGEQEKDEEERPCEHFEAEEGEENRGEDEEEVVEEDEDEEGEEEDGEDESMDEEQRVEVEEEDDSGEEETDEEEDDSGEEETDESMESMDEERREYKQMLDDEMEEEHEALIKEMEEEEEEEEDED